MSAFSRKVITLKKIAASFYTKARSGDSKKRVKLKLVKVTRCKRVKFAADLTRSIISRVSCGLLLDPCMLLWRGMGYPQLPTYVTDRQLINSWLRQNLLRVSEANEVPISSHIWVGLSTLNRL